MIKKIRANLYLGLGGSGIKTVDLIKQLVFSSDNSHNMASAFCAIDADIVSLDNCKSLLSCEFLNINDDKSLYERYILNKERYDVPDKNIGFLKSLGGCGAGAIRSNGHFCFLFKKDIIDMQIRRACDGLKKEYYLDGVDVHLFFSLCGGTGSGIFYDVAKLVKQIIPSSNIIYYVFSNAYFPDFVRMKLFEANTCASLFELNNLPFLHNRLIYIDKQYSGKDVIISNNYYSLNYVVKQSVEEIFGYSLFINCPSDKRILDFKSFDTNVNNEHCSPFSASVFEDLYNNMMYNGMV